MIDPAEVERYRLPQEENERIFREGIVPELLHGRASQETPTVVFLVGQPGVGKSRVTEMVAAQLNRHGGFVDVDSDLYKPYHPAYPELMARDDALMAAYTRADGRAWMAQAEQYVRDHGLHAIIQETSQNAEAVAEKMRAYREAGARIEGLFMGVPPAMSNQGIVARNIEQLADRGQGRLTVQANADESYRGILDLADRVDAAALVDLASVYRRGETKPRYSNNLDETGAWTNPPALRQSLESERARPWTDAESTSFVTTQLRLREAGRGLGGRMARPARDDRSPGPTAAHPCRWRPARTARPSSAAACSRSTTTGRRPSASEGARPSERPRTEGYQPPGPEQRRGPSR
ncbi:zeta toxin family protein [Streptomyces leeuwenhoekii]|uniref:zeta toxin family protein n=1 Tax=Streptomyces leeuwenhoekii TaxID=1437453 RepID=UPI003687566B